MISNIEFKIGWLTVDLQTHWGNFLFGFSLFPNCVSVCFGPFAAMLSVRNDEP